jgi:hypothetical protein
MTDITLGMSTALALISDGTLQAWGNNDDAPIVDKTYFNRNTPVSKAVICATFEGIGHY